MKVEFAADFAKDLRTVTNSKLRERLARIIEALERAPHLQGFAQLKKLQGNSKAYRIRVGDYRLGLLLEGQTVIVARFLHRREIYRHFP